MYNLLQLKDNMNESDKPPPLQDSKRNCSSLRYSRVGLSDLYRIPIWRGGNLAGMAIHRDISRDCLYKHKVMDLVFRATR